MSKWEVKYLPNFTEIREFFLRKEDFFLQGAVGAWLRYVFIMPFSIIAAAGFSFVYIFFILLFPTYLLKLGLDITNNQATVGWFVWVVWVFGFYSLLFWGAINRLLAHVKQRILNVPLLLQVLLFICGYLLVAWIIPPLIHNWPVS